MNEDGSWIKELFKARGKKCGVNKHDIDYYLHTYVCYVHSTESVQAHREELNKELELVTLVIAKYFTFSKT